MDFGHIIPVVAIIAPFVMIISIQIAKSIARTHQERMRCEVMRAAIERGQPIPAEALRPLPDDDEESLRLHRHAPAGHSAFNDIRAGLICMGVGAGLYLMFATFQVGNFDGLRGLRWVGAIPGFVGLALFVYGMIHRAITPAEKPESPRASDPHREPRS